MSTRSSVGRKGEKHRRPVRRRLPDAGPLTLPGQENTQAENRAEALKRKLLRLALDVHDGPMQNLAVIGFNLGDLRSRMRALVPPEHHSHIDAGMEQIGAELGQVERELRALITALEEGATQSIPLRDAIENEVATFAARSGTKIECAFEDDVRAETDSQRIALQAVARSALANVAKHANANHVKVSLTGTSETVTLEVEDDGRGFRPSTATKPGRFGLAGMRERVELLGGKLTVKSRPGGPTRITATLQTWRPPAA